MSTFRLTTALSLLLGISAFAGQTPQTTSPDKAPEGLSKSDWQSIRSAHEAWRHQFHAVEGGWLATNPGQNWTTRFDGRGFLATPKGAEWTWGLEFRGYGFGHRQTEVSGTPSVHADGQRLTYKWNESVEEWFINDTRGLEHGFTLSERPDGGGEGEPLVFSLATRGPLTPVTSADHQTVMFRDANGGHVLNYSGLKVWDADGKVLPSRFQVAGREVRLLVEESSARYPLTIDPLAQQAYLKAGNNGVGNANFGASVAISGDTVVVGAPNEASSSTGVDSIPNEDAYKAGAAYVFVRDGTTWSQQAYLKPSDTAINNNFNFGRSVAVSGDTVVVGAPDDDRPEIPGTGEYGYGAAYVFVREGTMWSQHASIRAGGQRSWFGYSVAISGNTVVVGASRNPSRLAVRFPEDPEAEAFVFVFVRNGSEWAQQTALRATNTGGTDFGFGDAVAISGDTLVVGAPGEDSSTTGVNSTPNTNAGNSGAAYVFTRIGSVWTQQAYLKASNTGGGEIPPRPPGPRPPSGSAAVLGDNFGTSVAVSGDTVVVGAPSEDSAATGVNGDGSSNSATNSGAAYVFLRSGGVWSQEAYIKASNTEAGDGFGTSVAVSGDSVVVGAPAEDSSTTGVNSTPDETALVAGAAYVFTRGGGVWSQQASIKSSNTGAGDQFGTSVAISGDTLVIGAGYEDSGTTGVNSSPNESATDSGSAYVFTRAGSNWTQQAYVKASNTPSGVGAYDYFGSSVAVSGDTVVVGAYGEDSSTTGVNTTLNESAADSGAVYVFTRGGGLWSQQAYLKASNTGIGDFFGRSVAISGDTVVVGAQMEDSATTGVNTTPDESASDSGAAYVFTRTGSVWTQQAYLKASNTGADDWFGNAVAVSADTVVVGAVYEDSSTTGVNSISNESANQSGAAYAFTRNGATWSQHAYLKASNTGTEDNFGFSVAVSGDTVVVGARFEDSSTTGVNTTSNESAAESGAAYVFLRSGSDWSHQAYLKASNTASGNRFGNSVAISGDTVAVGAPLQAGSGAAYVFFRNGGLWSQQAFLKASNTGADDWFGSSVAVSGDMVVVGALYEDSSTSGVNTTPNESAYDSGAAYVFTRGGGVWSQQSYLKAFNTGGGDAFGSSVAVSGDTVVVGAPSEDSSKSGVNTTPNESGTDSGAAYIFSEALPADIALEVQPGTSVESGSETVQFDPTLAGQSRDKPLTLRNTGNAELTGISATIGGTDAAHFSVFTAPPETLAGGASAAFTVRFTPTTPGVKTATLSIASSDTDENPFILNLSGTVNTPPVFSGFAISTAWQTPVAVSFGKLLLNASDADSHALAVTAAGPASAQGGSAVMQASSVLYTPPASYSGTDTFPVTIADGFGGAVTGNVTVTIGAAPGTGGGSTTNPPQVTVGPGGQPKLTFQGIPGRTYRVERTTNMTNWTFLANVTASPNGTVEYTDTNPPSGGSAFYRISR